MSTPPHSASALLSDDQKALIANYADQHDIYGLFHDIIQKLVIEKPSDPIQTMIDALKRPKVPQIILYGPPSTNRFQLAQKLASRTNTVLISTGSLLRHAIEKNTSLGQQARTYVDRNQPVPDTILNGLVMYRFSDPDVLQKGYVLEGYPRTKEQVVQLRTRGVLPTHFVYLDYDERVLGSRCEGLLFDPVSKMTYGEREASVTTAIAQRSVKRAKDAPESVKQRLVTYKASSVRVLEAYKHIVRRVTVDSVTESLDSIVERCLKVVGRHVEVELKGNPKMMKVAVVGPAKVGKSGACQKFADRYGVVNVSVKNLILSEISRGTEAGVKLSAFLRNPHDAPDDVVVPLVKARLESKECREHGWILDDYPRTKAGAEKLKAAGIEPNRVVVLTPDETGLPSTFTRTQSELVSYYGVRKHGQEKGGCVVQVQVNSDSHHTADLIEGALLRPIPVQFE